MRGNLSLGVALITLLLVAEPAMAHHSFSAEFDVSKPITLRGTLIRMEWVNPHGWLHLTVKDAEGKEVTWMGETGAPNVLIRRGWTKESLKPGMELVLEGYRSKDGTRKMTAMSVVFPDGAKLFANSPGTGAPEPPPTK